MKITDAIAQHILEAFEGVNWTEVDLKNVLADVSFAEAVTQTKASPNTIASVVYHLIFYNEVMLSRINSKPIIINQRNGFDMPFLNTAEEWNALRDNLYHSAKKLSDTVKDFPEEKLFEPLLENYSTAYKNFHGIAEHAHYHLGQIFILKNAVRKPY